MAARLSVSPRSWKSSVGAPDPEALKPLLALSKYSIPSSASRLVACESGVVVQRGVVGLGKVTVEAGRGGPAAVEPTDVGFVVPVEGFVETFAVVPLC